MTARALTLLVVAACAAACDGPTPHTTTTDTSSVNSQSSGGSSATPIGPSSCASGEVLVIVNASGGTPGAASAPPRAECMSEANYQQSYGRSEHCRRDGARADCEAHYPSAAR
ncbi:MAG: hypothetical protein U0269_19065 [Polyangiales bacterium]